MEKDNVTLRLKQHRLIESVDYTIEDHEAKMKREKSKWTVSPPPSLSPFADVIVSLQHVYPWRRSMQQPVRGVIIWSPTVSCNFHKR